MSYSLAFLSQTMCSSCCLTLARQSPSLCFLYSATLRFISLSCSNRYYSSSLYIQTWVSSLNTSRSSSQLLRMVFLLIDSSSLSSQTILRPFCFSYSAISRMMMRGSSETWANLNYLNWGSFFLYLRAQVILYSISMGWSVQAFLSSRLMQQMWPWRLTQGFHCGSSSLRSASLAREQSSMASSSAFSMISYSVGCSSQLTCSVMNLLSLSSEQSSSSLSMGQRYQIQIGYNESEVKVVITELRTLGGNVMDEE